MSILIARRTPYSEQQPQIVDTILPTIVKNIDSLSTSTTKSVKWLVTIVTQTTFKTVAYEIFATHRNGISPIFNRGPSIGDTVLRVDDVVISGGSLILKITNNEIETFSVNVLRLAVGL